jgi:hypothetical protein
MFKAMSMTIFKYCYKQPFFEHAKEARQTIEERKNLWKKRR